MRRALLAAAAALALGPFAAGAQEAPATFAVKLMSPETALALALAALEDCRGKDFQVAVSVVDRFGGLQVAIRDRFAGPHAPETARRKAWTAVSFRTDTGELAELSGPGAGPSGLRHLDQVLMVGGGVPVESAGSLVGGVGVSGAPGGDADAECARAGIEAVADRLMF